MTDYEKRVAALAAKIAKKVLKQPRRDHVWEGHDDLRKRLLSEGGRDYGHLIAVNGLSEPVSNDRTS